LATESDLEIYQGDDYSVVAEVYNSDGSVADLTGYTAKTNFRYGPAEWFPPELILDCPITLPNQVLVHVPHTETEMLAVNHVWDLQLHSPAGTVMTALAGRVLLTKEVTK
jgi:hypothetical protein